MRNVKFLSDKSKTHDVTRLADGIFKVVSGSSLKSYVVAETSAGIVCTCDWHLYHVAGECSHTVAVRAFLLEENGRKLGCWASDVDAKRQHRKNEGSNFGVYFTSRK